MLKKLHYTDNDALQLLMQGKEEGLDHFFNAYYNYLLYFANEILRDPYAAEEVTADVFVKLWHHREKLDPTLSIKAWLVKVVRNGAIDRLKQSKRLRINGQGLESSEMVEGSILPKLIAAETLHQLVRILALLTPQQRKVFCLYYFHHLSHQEIAKELKLSPITVRGTKLRAVEALKQKLHYLLLLLAPFL